MKKLNNFIILVFVSFVLTNCGCSKSEPDTGIGPIRTVDSDGEKDDSSAGLKGSERVRLLQPPDGEVLKPNEPFDCVAEVGLAEDGEIPTSVIAEIWTSSGPDDGGALVGNAVLKPGDKTPNEQHEADGPARITYRGTLKAPKNPGKYVLYVKSITAIYVADPSGSRPEDRSVETRSNEIELTVEKEK